MSVLLRYAKDFMGNFQKYITIGHLKTVVLQKAGHWHRRYFLLHKMCPYSELFLSAYPRIWTESGDSQSKYCIQYECGKNSDLKNTDYRHFSRNVSLREICQTGFCLTRILACFTQCLF